MPCFEWNFGLEKWQKICTKCDRVYYVQAASWNEAREKFLQFFNPGYDRSKDDLHCHCKICRNAARHDRISNGLSAKEMLDIQYNKCAICEDPLEDRKAHVDHDHATGETRKVLCTKCNNWMAGIDDDDWLAKAIAYRDHFRG